MLGASPFGNDEGGGAYCALVSGGFTAFTGAIANVLGFDENRANTLLIAEGKLTGEVAEPILGKAAKVQALQEISARMGITPAEAIAVGDGANDLGMLGAAGSGVALREALRRGAMRYPDQSW